MARATDPTRVVRLLESVWPKHEVQKSGQEHMVQCPFCATDKAKCAINPEKGVFQCWVCGERGPVMKLFDHLRILRVISSSDIEAVKSGNKLIKLSEGIKSLVKPQEKEEITLWSQTTPCVLPPHTYALENFRPHNLIEGKIRKRVMGYLNGRGLTDDDIYKYRLHFCSKPGSVYHAHILIPALGEFGRQMVYWTTRSTLPNAKPKSLHAGSKYSRFSAKTVLFNEHLVVGTTMALCEGPFDAWSIMKVTGIPACPLLGKKLHKYHLELLKRKGVEQVYVCLDPDAKAAQGAISRDLVDKEIQPILVNLEEGDPNDIDPIKLYAAFEQAAYKPNDPCSDWWEKAKP